MDLKQIAFGCLLLAGSLSVIADPVKGESVRSRVEVGGMMVPLPAGEWTVVADQTGVTAIDGMLNGPRWKALYLVQHDLDRRFLGSVYVRASTSSARVTSWNDGLCDRKDTLYRDTLDGTIKSPNCLLINHLVRYQQAVPRAEFDKQVWEWLQKERIQLPQTSLQVQSRFYRFGDFLFVNYSLNPELAGFAPSSVSDWSSSEWHALKVKNDPARLAYVERVKAYARQTATIHQAALRGGGPSTVELEALPR